MHQGRDGDRVRDEGEGFGGGAADDGVGVMGDGFDEEGGGGGSYSSDRFCEV